ncbi:RICIN domain-containing protein [Glycomyces niveus]|uniref:RICIN domain-containing protein n=1 Tax=Glycomyces niveus TaxID=2820287 RepID=A0ABS3U6K6_9ACTN|nr:RICIN domain-containing protein [Glycomyces sp. NEAU-S30]MBO3734399.1 RICIN domain-containing protein [Glycomyces sp. NEAU-S30]
MTAASPPFSLSRHRRLAIALAVLVTGALVAASLAFWQSGKANALQVGVWYNIESRHSGLVLGIRAASTASGAELVQWSSNGSTDQQFRFVDAGGGYYKIQVRHSNQVLDVEGASTADGAKVQQWGDAGSANQQWRVTESGGYATIVNRASGKALDVWAWSTTAGGRISQYTATGATNQQWKLNPAGSTSLPPGVDVLDGFGEGTTGGQGGTTVTVTTQADLERYAAASGSYVIKVAGTINMSPKGREIPVSSDKTIIGTGTAGQIVGGGFFLGDATSNVIIRNLTIRDTMMADDDPDDKLYDYDGIQMDGADRVWIDHNRIYNMNDGIIDSRKDTTNLTVSWNVLGPGNKAFGIGWTENTTARITIHHNWIHDTNQRNPSTDNVAYAHLYNNYLQNISGYGNYSRGSTKMVLENSYFQNVANPYYPDATAQLRQTGSICSGCTGRQETLGSAFTPSSFYTYTLDPAAEVPNLVRTYGGPQSWLGV